MTVWFSFNHSMDSDHGANFDVGQWTTTVSIFAGSSVIAEYDNGAAPASPSREYIYNPAGGDTTGLLAMISDGAMTYYHQDHLSARLTTDGNGNILTQEGTYPFGEKWYETGPTNKWFFTSYDRDPESGLDYPLARYYDSRTGTFCSADPLAGSADDPQSWNRYPYGRNDPIDITDPSGQSWWSSLLIDIGIGVASYFLGPEIESWLGIGGGAAGGGAAAAQAQTAADVASGAAIPSSTAGLFYRGAASAISAGVDAAAGAGGGVAWGLGGAAGAAAAQATDHPKAHTPHTPIPLTPQQQNCLGANIAQINKVSNLNVTPNNLANPPYMYNGGMDFDFSVAGASQSALPAARYPSSIFNFLTGIGHSLHVPSPGGADPSTYGTGANGAFTFTTHMDTAYSTWHTPIGAMIHGWVDVRDKGAHRKPCGGSR